MAQWLVYVGLALLLLSGVALEPIVSRAMNVPEKPYAVLSVPRDPLADFKQADGTVEPLDLFRPILDGLKYFFGLEWLFGKAAAADRFLVLGNVGCTVTAIATDADCWSATSGGGSSTVPSNIDRALLDVNSGGGTGTMNAAMDVQEWCSADFCNGAGGAFAGSISTGGFSFTIGSGGLTGAGILQMGGSTITVAGSWNSANQEQYAGSSTVRFVASADVTVNPTNGAHVHFYNVVVDAGVTVTSRTDGVEVYNQLTVNGVLQTSDIAGGVFSWMRVQVLGYLTATPLVLGPQGDVSRVADFRYLVLEVGGVTTHYVAATTYHYLDIPAGNVGTTVRLAGNIRTACIPGISEFSPGVPKFNRCAMLIAGWTPGLKFNFHTDNYRMDVAGMLWIGDVSDRSVNFYAGSSVINAGGIQIKESSIVYWQTATVTSTELFGQGGQPGYSHQGQVYVYAGGATFDINGDFFFYNATSESPSYLETALYSNSSVWTISGWAVIRGWKSWIEFGSSTWTVGIDITQTGSESLGIEGWWFSESRDSRWSVGTSTVTIRADADGRFNSAGTPLGEPEFNNLILETTSGVRTYLMNTRSPNTLGLWTNNLTVRGGGGTTTLNMNSKAVRIDGALLLDNGGSILNAGATQTIDSVTYSGGTASADIAARSLTFDGTAFGAVLPTGVVFTTSVGRIGNTVWNAFNVSVRNFDIDWSFNPDTTDATITVAVTGVPTNIDYKLFRDGTSVSTDFNSDSIVSFTVAAGWSPHTMQVAIAVGGNPSIGQPNPGDRFRVVYLNDCLSVTFVDTLGPGTLYLWSFDDDTIVVIDQPFITHTYTAGGTYQVIVLVFETGATGLGQSTLYIKVVNVGTFLCTMANVVEPLMTTVPLLALAILDALYVLTVLVLRRYKISVHKSIRRLALVSMLSINAIFLASAIILVWLGRIQITLPTVPW